MSSLAIPGPLILTPVVELPEWVQKIVEVSRNKYREFIHEAGFFPDEGDALANDLIYAAANVNSFATNTDRAANLELGLFTNVSPAETQTEAAITEPTGGGYARIALVDGTWAGTNPKTYPQQQFSPSGSDFVGSIQGYFIATNLAGTGTKRLLLLEVDSAGPYTMTDGDTYDIDLSNTAE